MARNGKMLEAYRRQDWAKARALLQECRRLDGALEEFYNIYEARVNEYEADPPVPPGTEWDGVYRATSK